MSTEAPPFREGDVVVHTNSHRVGRVEEVRSIPRDADELRVMIVAGDIPETIGDMVWWSAARVRHAS